MLVYVTDCEACALCAPPGGSTGNGAAIGVGRTTRRAVVQPQRAVTRSADASPRLRRYCGVCNYPPQRYVPAQGGVPGDSVRGRRCVLVCMRSPRDRPDAHDSAYNRLKAAPPVSLPALCAGQVHRGRMWPHTESVGEQKVRQSELPGSQHRCRSLPLVWQWCVIGCAVAMTLRSRWARARLAAQVPILMHGVRCACGARRGASASGVAVSVPSGSASRACARVWFPGCGEC